jgi:hypothetical protein
MFLASHGGGREWRVAARVHAEDEQGDDEDGGEEAENEVAIEGNAPEGRNE